MNYPPQGYQDTDGVSIILPGATGGPLYLTKNAAGAPPYSFAGDTNCGVDSYAADTVDLVGGGVSLFKVSASSIISQSPLQAASGIRTLDNDPTLQLLLGGSTMTADATATSVLLKGRNAYAQSTTDKPGSNLILAGGIGRRFVTIVDATLIDGGVDTVTLTVNGTATVITAGTGWTVFTNNTACAADLASYINGLGLAVTALASSGVCYITPTAACYSFTLATNMAAGEGTVTSGTNGNVSLYGTLKSIDNTQFATYAEIGGDGNEGGYLDGYAGPFTFGGTPTSWQFKFGASKVMNVTAAVDTSTANSNWSGSGWRSNSATTMINFGGAGAATDVAWGRQAAGVMQLCTGTANAGAALEFFEQTAPAAPAANGCRIYCVDSGGGKTQLRALFNSGASQLIAAEP